MLKIWNAYNRYCQNQLYNGVNVVGLFVTYSDLPVTLLIDNIFRCKKKIILNSELHLWCIGCYTGIPVGVINTGGFMTGSNQFKDNEIGIFDF